MQNEPMIKPLMTKGEFGALINVSQKTLRELIRSGEISLVGNKIPAREYYKLINPQITPNVETGDTK